MPTTATTQATLMQHDLDGSALKGTDSEDGETQDVPFLVNFFHDPVVLCGAEESGLLVEGNFEEVGFRVEPHFHGFRCHRICPLFIRSVRYAVTRNASESLTRTTAHRYFPPTGVRW